MYDIMQQQSPVRADVSNEESYTSSSGSDTASTAESTASDSHALPGHIEGSSAYQHQQSTSVNGQPTVARAAAAHKRITGDEQKAPSQSSTPALGHQGIQTSRVAAPAESPGQYGSPTEDEQLLDRKDIIRRLSQSVLALSSNTLSSITDEHSPDMSNNVASRHMDDTAAPRHRHASTVVGAASERYDFVEPDIISSADAASGAKQQSLPDRGQALTQVTQLPGPEAPWHSHSPHYCTGSSASVQ